MIFKPVLPVYVLVFIALAFIAFVVFMLMSKHQRNLPIRRTLMLVLMFMILLRPMVGGGVAVQQESSTDVFFAVDLTNSMTVDDCKDGQRRFEKMSADVRKIAESFPGARFSIIALDYTTHVALPLTDDLDAVLNYAGHMTVTDSKKSNGSDLSGLIVYTMEHISKYHESFPERKNVLFVMSDGERTQNTDPAIPREQLMALNATRVYGYGTREGGFVNKVGYGKINSSVIGHVSSLDEKNLQNIADVLYGDYEDWTATDFDEQKIKDISKALDLNDSGVVKSYRDIYWLLALVLGVLLLWELSDCLNKVLDERKAIKK